MNSVLPKTTWNSGRKRKHDSLMYLKNYQGGLTDCRARPALWWNRQNRQNPDGGEMRVLVLVSSPNFSTSCAHWEAYLLLGCLPASRFNEYLLLFFLVCVEVGVYVLMVFRWDS